jgi:hypothetical protein
MDVFSSAGATRNDMDTASSARTRRGTANEPKIGAVIKSVLVLARTSTKTRKRLTRKASKAGICSRRVPLVFRILLKAKQTLRVLVYSTRSVPAYDTVR